MTETATGQQAAQSVNGAAPGPAADPPAEPDTGEKWLGVLLLAAAAFLGFVAVDRLTGGKLTAPFYRETGDAGG